MVWQVQNLKYPTLINLTSRCPDCRIKLAENKSRLDIARPFVLYDPSGIRKYEIMLDETRGGLIRMINSRIRTTAEETDFGPEASELSELLMSKGLPETEILTIRRRFVGYADFEDFKSFGEFALSHFPQISKEASQKPSELGFLSEEELLYLERMRYKDPLDYAQLQADVTSIFYDLFKNTAIERSGFALEKKGLSAEQIRELIKLTEPLKK